MAQSSQGQDERKHISCQRNCANSYTHPSEKVRDPYLLAEDRMTFGQILLRPTQLQRYLRFGSAQLPRYLRFGSAVRRTVDPNQGGLVAA